MNSFLGSVWPFSSGVPVCHWPGLNWNGNEARWKRRYMKRSVNGKRATSGKTSEYWSLYSRLGNVSLLQRDGDEGQFQNCPLCVRVSVSVCLCVCVCVCVCGARFESCRRKLGKSGERGAGCSVWPKLLWVTDCVARKRL